MSIATPLIKIPPSVMTALLQTVTPVDDACPFGFLLPSHKGEASASGDEARAALKAHTPWLWRHQIMAEGTETLTPSWERALTIVARPRRRLAITDTSPDKVRRVMFVSDGQELVFAMFDRQSCLVSEPVTFGASVERLLQTIGVPEGAGPTPLSTTPEVLRLMGALAAAGLGAQPSRRLGAAAHKTPQRTLSEQRAAEVLGEALQDPAMGSALLVDMIADRILLAEQQKMWVHPHFLPWHRAIASGAMLEVVRQELPGGKVPTSKAPEVTRGVFLGPAHQRCLLWPSTSEPDEVLLARPERKPLHDILLHLLGASDADDLSLKETLARSSHKFSFRG